MLFCKPKLLTNESLGEKVAEPEEIVMEAFAFHMLRMQDNNDQKENFTCGQFDYSSKPL